MMRILWICCIIIVKTPRKEGNEKKLRPKTRFSFIFTEVAMLKKAILQFNLMHESALLLLLLCLNVILISLCALCIYIDTAPKYDLFALVHNQDHIIETFLNSLLLSFCGAFLLDYAHAERKRN